MKRRSYKNFKLDIHVQAHQFETLLIYLYYIIQISINLEFCHFSNIRKELVINLFIISISVYITIFLNAWELTGINCESKDLKMKPCGKPLVILQIACEEINRILWGWSCYWIFYKYLKMLKNSMINCTRCLTVI